MQNTSSEIIENNNSKTLNRISTKEEWELANPVLQFGELGFEKDGQMTNTKLGDGVTAWNFLPYIWKQCPYEVGDILYTENETSPSIRWPGTTWEALPGGHCLVAAGTNPNTGTVFAVGDTGGEEAHQLTIGEMPSHSHDIITGSGSSKLNRRWQADISNVSGNTTDDLDNAIYRSAGTFNVGSNASHNNLSPYFVVYIWRRTL